MRKYKVILEFEYEPKVASYMPDEEQFDLAAEFWLNHFTGTLAPLYVDKDNIDITLEEYE